MRSSATLEGRSSVRPTELRPQPLDLREGIGTLAGGALVSEFAVGLVAFAAAAAAIFVVHIPVLDHYFFGDDFVPLADVASQSTWGYIKNLVLLDDPTPNWRFLTGLFYLGTYRAFGLSPFPFLLSSVLVHIATSGLIFWLVRRVTGNAWPAFLAAAFFGLAAAPVPTVGQVTAFNNVLAGFFAMLAVVALDEGFRGSRLRPWLAASALAFAAAIASNESAVVLAPLYAAVALWSAWRVGGRSAAGHVGGRSAAGLAGLDGRRWVEALLATVPFALIGGLALLAFNACACTSASNGEIYGLGGHVFDNLWIYTGRLLYPVGIEPLGAPGTAHLAAGIALVAVSAVFLVRGPGLARVAVVFLALALLPIVPIKLWSAPRYVYVAAIPFSILAALFFVEAARYGGRLTPALPGLLALVAFGVLALYGWQTWTQNAAFAEGTERWEEMVQGLQARYPDPPAGSTVLVHGGPLTHELLQCKVLPAMGTVLWGDVKLLTFYTTYMVGQRIRPGYNVFVAAYAGGEMVPIAVPHATEDELNSDVIVLQPKIAPEAEGDLCRPDVPLLP